MLPSNIFSRFVLDLGISILILGAIPSTSAAQAQTNNPTQLYKKQIITNGWSYTLEGKTNLKPSAIFNENNDSLVQVVVGTDSKIYQRSCSNYIVADSCTLWSALPGSSTQRFVSLVEFKGQFYIAVRGNDGKIYTAKSADAINWGGWTKDQASYTDEGVTMVVDKTNGKIYQMAVGSGSRIYTRSSTNGSTWTNWTENGGNTQMPIAGTVYKGKIYQLVVGLTDKKIYSRTSTNGTTWTNWVRDDISYTEFPVSLNVVSYSSNFEFLQMSATGSDRKIYHKMSLLNQSLESWSNWDSIGQSYNMPELDMIRSASAVDVITFKPYNNTIDFTLYTIRGEDGRIYWT